MNDRNLLHVLKKELYNSHVDEMLIRSIPIKKVLLKQPEALGGGWN